MPSSETYFVLPSTLARASTLGTLLPTKRIQSSSVHLFGRARHGRDGFDDVVVAGAPAQIAPESLLDLLLSRGGDSQQEGRALP